MDLELESARARGETLIEPTGRLIVTCPDQPGIVAALSGLLGEVGANITQSDQFSSDPAGGEFLMRVEFHVGEGGFEELAARMSGLGRDWQMRWKLWHHGERRRMALLVSRYEHCLLDLLWRHRRGELACDIPMVISNHDDLQDEVRSFGIPFHQVPVFRVAKEQAEERMLELLAGQCDVVVLARYMQILSGDFLEQLGVPVINIHHSFLPAFVGADPYARARDRGVKLIGATAHYVIEELDAGPIIEQDVVKVKHSDTTESLTHAGGDVERIVLARAVKWHLEDRVLVTGGRTVVFA
jgi:formyltetrahydrofolate deformylase